MADEETDETNAPDEPDTERVHRGGKAPAAISLAEVEKLARLHCTVAEAASFLLQADPAALPQTARIRHSVGRRPQVRQAQFAAPAMGARQRPRGRVPCT